jgi:hypothetical protein
LIYYFFLDPTHPDVACEHLDPGVLVPLIEKKKAEMLAPPTKWSCFQYFTNGVPYEFRSKGRIKTADILSDRVILPLLRSSRDFVNSMPSRMPVEAAASLRRRMT